MTDELLTVAQASALKGGIVYGLVDELGIFYVGKTVRPWRRFKQHRECRALNQRLNERIGNAGPALRVVVLQRDPSDINAAERHEIRSRTGLVNIVGVVRPFWSFPKAKYTPEVTPWKVAGHESPSAWARRKTGDQENQELLTRLAAMSPAQRCGYELMLLESYAPIIRRRFDGWLAHTRDAMGACLGAA